MQEFDSIKVSSYDAEKLAEKLTERSAEGWSVVGIVNAGSDILAYVSRQAGAAASTSPAAAAGTAGAAAGTASSGWDDRGRADTGGAQPAAASEPSGWGTTSGAETGEWGTADTGAATGAGAGAAADTGQSGTPAVPPGWFNDPAGRFDLRYWDGNQWTEHVTRGGQQYTDPPVA